MEVSPKIKPSDTKFRERRVFLFEQIIITSEEIEKKKNSMSSSGYIFKNSLKVSDYLFLTHWPLGEFNLILSR